MDGFTICSNTAQCASLKSIYPNLRKVNIA
jgi:hypothetical protein